MNRHHPLVQAAIRNFITFNPMFLLSALLLLGGAWLVNPPRLDGGRDRGLLLQLFGAVQLYEVALLGAAYLLARRAGLSRDVRNLALVLAPFLMDISCTNALVAEQTGTWPGHLLAILGLFGLVAGKTAVASRLVGTTFSPRAWCALLAGPFVVLMAPLAASFLAHHGFEGEVTLAGGLALAALILLWGFAHEPDAPGGAALRGLAPIVLGVATWHALGTAWSHTGSLLHVIGPALIALGPVLPRLAWPGLAARDAWTPLLLPTAGALLCGLPGLEGREPELGLSAWQLGLLGMAVAHGVAFRRHGTPSFMFGLLVAIDLAAGGATLERSLAHAGRGYVEPLALTALFAYAVARRAHASLCFAPLGLAALLLLRLRPTSDPLDLALVLDLLGAGLLAWTHRTHGRGVEGAAWRFLGAGLLWLPIQALALRGASDLDVTPWLARGTLLALLGLAAGTRLRVYALPALLLPLDGVRHAAPGSTAGWGALGIAFSFVAVGLGVLVSLKRDALLAWFERQQTDEPAAPAALSPLAVDGARKGAQLAVAGFLALAPLMLVIPDAGSDRRRAAQGAEAALLALAHAQSQFRNHDRDGDGVHDYAACLEELARAGLIRGALAAGEGDGYRFEMIVGRSPEEQWMAVATPARPSRLAQCLAITQAGMVVRRSEPIPLDPDCGAPRGAK